MTLEQVNTLGSIAGAVLVSVTLLIKLYIEPLRTEVATLKVARLEDAAAFKAARIEDAAMFKAALDRVEQRHTVIESRHTTHVENNERHVDAAWRTDLGRRLERIEELLVNGLHARQPNGGRVPG